MSVPYGLCTHSVCGAVGLFNRPLSQKYVLRSRAAETSSSVSRDCVVTVCVAQWGCVGLRPAARSLLTIHHLLLPPRHGGDGEIWLALAHCAGVLATIDSACTPLRDEGARLLEARGCEAGTMV